MQFRRPSGLFRPCPEEQLAGAMADPDHPSDAFFLIVADLDTGMFCVEGPMSDDAPWHVAAGRAGSSTIVTSSAARPAQIATRSPANSSAHTAIRRRSARQHRAATRMSDQLPAVIRSGPGCDRRAADTYIVPALIADAGDAGRLALRRILHRQHQQPDTRAAPMRAPAAGSSPGASSAA